MKVESYSTIAEQYILGTIISDYRLYYDIECVNIREEDFFHTSHKIIYKSITTMINQGIKIDFIILRAYMEKDNLLSSIGGLSYLEELSFFVTTEEFLYSYINLLKDLGIRREITKLSNDMKQIIESQTEKSSTEILDLVQRKINKIQVHYEHSSSQSLSNCLVKVIHNLKIGYKPFSLPSGFQDLDNIIRGFNKGTLSIIAGRPGMGKTTLAINIMENILLQEINKPILFFSIEMSSEEIAMRMLSSLAHVNHSDIRDNTISDNDWKKINDMMAYFNQFPLFIDDSSILTPSIVQSKARKLYMEHGGLSMIVLDYIQLMTIPSYNNRVQEVSEISRSLKILSKEMQVPIIVLSQLNRNLEERIDKRPVLSDLRESGALEQDSDLIIFIYRDEIYNKDSLDKDLAELIIGKNRNGPTGKSYAKFNGNQCCFLPFHKYKS
jgi:replicative DNA helicase